MAADQRHQAGDLLGTLQGISVPGVEIRHLVGGEISQAETVADIEGGLVQVLDPERRVGGMAKDEVEIFPDLFRRPVVVPPRTAAKNSPR